MYAGPQNAYRIGPVPAGYLTEQPPDQAGKSEGRQAKNDEPSDPRVLWARRYEQMLKRERQNKTDEMRRNQELFRGGTPWWGRRAPWKLRTRLNYCVAEGQRVATYSGLVPIEQAAGGTALGPISAKYDNGVKSVVRLRTARGFRVICTPDHQILTDHGWVEAQDALGLRAVLGAPTFSQTYASQDGIRVDEDFGRFLGYYMGDGCCYPAKGNVSITTFRGDEEICADVAATVGRVFGREPRVYDQPAKGQRTATLWSAEAVRTLQRLGAATEKRTVCVPDVIFRSPRSVVREFLRGLFEADGGCITRQAQLHLVAKNREFLADVQLLLLGFGIHGYIVEQTQWSGPNGPREPRGVAYHLVLNLADTQAFNREIGFISARKIERATRHAHGKPRKRFDLRDEIVAIEPAGEARVYDLTVEESHAFVAGGITVHNCAWVPQQWAAILTDNSPAVSFTAIRTKDQRIADIITEAFREAYYRLGWEQVIHDAVLLSRIEGKAYLRLTYSAFNSEPKLDAIAGQQVWMNKGARNTDTASVLLYEYREQISDLCARYPDFADTIRAHFTEERENNPGGRADDADTLVTPTSYITNPNSGSVTYQAPYETTASPPEQAGGSGGVLVQEFWTRPKRTIKIREVKFTATNEPAVRKKYITFEDGRREPLKRVVTEHNVIYELPMSTVAYLQYAGDALGGMKVLEVYDAVEVVTHDVEYPLYPNGRLLTVIDRKIPVDDGMAPTQYWPFAEIDAYRDPTSYLGWGDIEYIADLQEHMVRLLSLLFDAAMLTANPIWRLPLESDMADEDVTNAPGAILREDPISLKLGRREPGPDMPSYVMNLLQFVLAQIRDISGLTETATGGKFKGQQAAETVSMYQEAAGVRFREALHNLERTMITLGRHFMLMVAQFYTQPRIVQIKNDAGITEPVSFFGTRVASAAMKVEAKAGSQMPQSPSARLNMALNLLNSPKPILDLPEVWALLQEVGLINSASGLERRLEKELANPKDAWKVVGLQPPAGAKGGSPKKPRSARNKGAQSAS